MRIARCKRVERLGRYRVEQRIDWVGVGSLQSAVMLKTEPGCVVLIEIVVHAACLDLLGVGAGLRDAPTVRAAIPIRRIASSNAAVALEWAPQHSKRSSGRTFVEREHLL